MGLVRYYRRFIKKFLHIPSPSTSLQRKHKNFLVAQVVVDTWTNVEDCRFRQRVCAMYKCLQDKTWWSPYVGRTCSVL